MPSQGLNKAILDQGWGELTRKLGYKQGWSGGLLVLVRSQHTSQKCS
jgi:putative transposase